MGIVTRLLLGICLVQLYLFHSTYAQSRCNFTLTVRHNEKAVLKNPFYINNMDSCWFAYKVDRPGYGLRIDFTSFELEEKVCTDSHTNKTVCCDYLQIRSGTDIHSNALATLCGTTRPESMLVDSSAVWFNFHTNSEHTFDGFKLELTPYQLTFTEPSGVITSPDLVNHVRYANNMNVTYRIEARPSQVVSIRFQKLIIENFKGTCVDYLEIGPLDASSGVKPRRFCGDEDDQLERQFLIDSNRIYLKFVTDSTVTASGFELFYKIIQTEFTAPTGTVQLVEYPLDIAYTIRAPDGFKIELNVREFNFAECMTGNDISQLVSAPHQLCTIDNDHIRLSNQIGSLPVQIFKAMNESLTESIEGETGSKWVFCACNMPAKTYTSLSNELKIDYIHGKSSNATTSASISHLVQKNWFKIDYKFVPLEYVAKERLRLVQDQIETSLIGGYHLRVRVPANHHLRLFGKSVHCSMPTNSFLSKWKSNVANNTDFKILTKPLVLNHDAFKKNCSYLFDVSEPNSEDLFVERVDTWELSWFIKFDSPFDLYDFELDWKFIKNTLVDEAKSSSISLPKEIAFESIDPELIFVFKSLSSARKYTLGFEVKENELSRNEKVRDFIKIKSSSSSDFEKIADKTELAVDSTEFALKIKRSGALSLLISYKIGTQAGDCNFDQSICNYTSNLLADSALSSSPLQLKNGGQIIRHMPRYGSISVNDHELKSKTKDFYLAIFKTIDNTDSVFSPLIQVRKDSRSALFNKRVHTISFSYRISNHSMDQLEVFLVKNRSETTVKINANIKPRLVKEMIDKYDHISWERNKQVSLEKTDGICPSVSSMEMANRFASLAAPIAESNLDQAWYRVDQVKVFSCYDFRLGFSLRLDQQDAGRMRTVNSPPAEVGIDDVQINSGEELEECEENVCGANGICYMFEKRPTCCCMAGFEGNRCERKLSACQLSTIFDQTTATITSTICKNGGNCTDLSVAFDYKCECPPGYTGKNCEIEVNDCEPNPCLNNGRCIDRIGGFDCVCKTGFSGVRCEVRDEDCNEKCAAYGTDECIKDKTKPPICVCKPGFTGDNCAIKLKINKCLSSPCVGMSQCVNLDDSVKCVCPEDRTGMFCEVLLNYCDDHKDLCKNGSACVFANQDASSFNCSCAAGFKGRFCNETINDCLSNPCENGKCVDVEMGFKCECERGYVGRYCNIKPKDPCYRNKCMNGMCTPKIGGWGYNCNCYNEAEGEFCEKKKCDKAVLIGSQCSLNGTFDVVVMNGNCHCVCKNGYTGSNCESRFDLCELREKTGSLEKECKNGGTCLYNNVTNSISCKCPKGYKGDRCEIVVNYCSGEPCKNGLCKNNHDSYACECSPGWTGANCTEQISVCNMTEDCVAENTISVQHSKHSCVCLCKMGFTGKKCQHNIDDCANVKCENGGTCHDLVGSFRCNCPLGYAGPMCERKVENCDMNPCKNGNCLMLGTLLKCECDRGYTGKYCDTFIDKCKPNPCQNDAVCHNLIDSYHCECPPDFGTSQNCSDRLIDPCKNSPCFNNGQCSPIAKISDIDKKTLVYTGFTCLCPEDFTGRLCEQPRNPCDSNPCHNRGQCRPAMFNDNDYTCLCYPAYTGKNCESHFDPCKEPKNECLNGGLCLATRREGSKCKCPPNFSGEKCEVPISECDLMNCVNGGECVKHQGIPSCKCPNSRYAGTRCEIDLSILKPQNETAKYSVTASKSLNCGLLGNDIKPTDLVFFWLMIFGLFVLILAIVYTYVYLRIKKTQNYFKNMSSEKEALEINDSTERRLA